MPTPSDDRASRIGTSSAAKESLLDQVDASGFEPWVTKSISTTFGYDIKSANFTSSVAVAQKDYFKLIPLTTTQGSLKGQHVLMLLPMAQASRFLELPPELRTRIYDFLLGSDYPLFHMTASKYNAKLPKDEKPAYRRGGTKYVRRESASVSKRCYDPAINGAGILRVNKQVNEEVAAMLYGSSQFHIESLGKLKRFASSIGSMLVHLRDIRIYCLHESTFRSACNALKKATSLASLTIEYRKYNNPTQRELFDIGYQSGARMSWWTRDGTELVKDLLPLVRTLRAARKPQPSENDSSVMTVSTLPNPLDIVRFQYQRMYWCDRCLVGVNNCTAECLNDRKADAENLRLSLRAKLVAALSEISA